MRDSFIEFYGKNKISPVRQDISDIRKHFERREGLYRQLGIVPSMLSGKYILEVGPGSGHNSIYTASLNPEVYDIVEGNPTGAKDTIDNLQKHGLLRENIKVHQLLFQEYRSKYLYDIVLCEGVLPGLNDPIDMLLRLKEFVKPGGVLVITCIDAVSASSENLRNLIAQLLTWDIDDMETKLGLLTPAFESHLKTLKDMSRRYDDWIIDNIISPVGVVETLSISKAIEALNGSFEVYCSSPHFLSDWRWYKSIWGEKKSNSQCAIEQYWSSVHNFLDYRKTFPQRDSQKNKDLYHRLDEFRIKVRQVKETKEKHILKEIELILVSIINNIKEISPDITQVFEEVLYLLCKDNLTVEEVAGSKKFKSFFGRGQQYLSFIKNNSEA